MTKRLRRLLVLSIVTPVVLGLLNLWLLVAPIGGEMSWWSVVNVLAVLTCAIAAALNFHLYRELRGKRPPRS
jgi:hypothetical protein